MTALYPNEAVPDEVKNTRAYGASVGAYIEKQWFGSDNRYSTRRSEFVELRSYMKGDPDISNFSDILGIDKDRSTLALDWTPIRVIPRFVNDIVDSFAEEIVGIKARGIDPINNMKRQVYTEAKKKAMLTSQFTAEFNKAMGLNIGSDSPVPESNEELDLHMQLDYHPLSEIAAEECVTNWFELDNYAETKKQVDEDLVLVGEGGVRVRRNGDRITYERANPEEMIYSLDALMSRDGKGTLYYGHVRPISIGDFKHFCSSHGEEVTDEEIRTMIGSSSKYLKAYGQQYDERRRDRYDDDNLVILVIDMAYKTTNSLTYKKKYNKKGYKLTEKPSDFRAGEGFDVLRQEYDVWYEGLYVPGAGDVFGYRKIDYQPRKESNLKEPLEPFTYYRLSTESIGKRILPYAKLMYITYLKIQQLTARMRADGYAVDISALTDIDLMDGKKWTPMDVMSHFFQNGDLLYDGERLNGDYNPRPPIADMPKPVTGRMQELIGTYMHWLNMIQIDTGINEARSSIAPDPNAPVATQKMALVSSMNSTKHIGRAVLNITRRVAESTLMHCQLMAKNDIFSKQLANAIGSYNADALRELVKMGNYEYQVRLELAPTIEEREAFGKEIQLAIQQQLLTVDDLIDIRRVDDINLARVMLKVKTQKRAKAMAQMSQQAAQAEMQKEQAKMQAEIQKDTVTSKNKMQVDRNKIMLEYQHKFKYETNLLMFKTKFGDPDMKNKMALKEADRQIGLEKIDRQQGLMSERNRETKTMESEISKQKSPEQKTNNFKEGNLDQLIDMQ